MKLSIIDQRIRVVQYYTNSTSFYYNGLEHKVRGYTESTIQLQSVANGSYFDISYDEFFRSGKYKVDMKNGIREKYILVTRDEVDEICCDDLEEKLQSYSGWQQLNVNTDDDFTDEKQFMLFKLSNHQPKVTIKTIVEIEEV